MKNKSNPPSQLLHNSEPNIHPLDKAQVLNNFSTINNEKEITEILDLPNHSLISILITEQDIKDQLTNLNCKKPEELMKLCRN